MPQFRVGSSSVFLGRGVGRQFSLDHCQKPVIRGSLLLVVTKCFHMTDALHGAVGFSFSAPKSSTIGDARCRCFSIAARRVRFSIAHSPYSKSCLSKASFRPEIGGGPNTLRWDRDELIKHLQRRNGDPKIEDAKVRATAA